MMEWVLIGWGIAGIAGFFALHIRVFEFAYMERHLFGRVGVGRFAALVLCLHAGPLTFVRVYMDSKPGVLVT